MRLLTLLWLSLCLLSIAGGAARAQTPGRAEESPRPAGAKISLEADRQEYWIGENVLVHFVIENVGPEPFSFTFGGDSRGTPRHLRFNVTATSEDGVVAEDPFPGPQMNFGGFVSQPQLKPSERWTNSVPIARYCTIDKAGVHRVRISHDLGWKVDGTAPGAEIQIRFKMPDVGQAEEVVRAMAALPASASVSLGQRAEPYRDLRSLRLPIYLPPVLQRIENGNIAFFDVIDGMETPEATAALIRLTGHAVPLVAQTAADKLSARLPGPAPRFAAAARERLVNRSWDPKFVAPVRATAAALLMKGEDSAKAAGARMIAAIGIAEGAPTILRALESALDRTVNPRRECTENILDPPSPVRELMGALGALRSRGYSPSMDALSGDAEILQYFDRLAGAPAPRPERWLHLLEAFGAGSRYSVREAAVRSIPAPMPADCGKFVRERLEDRDLGVARAACTVAADSGDQTFIQPLLDIIATENHPWLLREAIAASQKLGAGYDLLVTVAERLPDEELGGIALDALQSAINLPQSHSGRTDLPRMERLALRTAWREFLTKHADALRAGKRFEVSDPAVTPALFGRMRQFTLPDGRSWPPQ
jgi:hypothetical protein